VNLFVKYRQSTRLQWIVRHTAFWLVLQPVILYQTYSYGFTSDINVVLDLEWLPLEFATVYSFLYGLLPLLLKGQLKKFFPGLIIWFALVFVATNILHYYVLIPLNTGMPLFDFNSVNAERFSMVNFMMFLSYTCVAASLKLLRYWYRKETNNQQLAKETMVAELQLLKAQVHPHFLFNTLNNLYSLTLKKSARSPEVVLKLSELLRYMLQECTATEVPVEKEVRMIENYIELEKLRYGKRLDIRMNVTGSYHEKNIAPLLLIPFVENAFKHGSAEQEGNAFIDISLHVDHELLSFSVRNSRSEPSSPAMFGGIGLTNVRKRLQLIYPGQYQLIVLPQNDIYEVKLLIYLSKKKRPAMNKFTMKLPDQL
jgi:sensor histidine kinase YesM